MKRNLMNLRRVGALVLLAAVLTIAGCSDNSVLGPDPNETIGLGNAKTVGLVLPEAASVVAEAAMAINAENGGVIPINVDNYRHSFIVEAGGLDSANVISIKVKNEKVNRKNAVSFEFGPDGLVFNEASKLEFEMAELNASAQSAKLYYFDPQVQNWVLQAEGQVVNGFVTFEIYHFSKYAISD